MSRVARSVVVLAKAGRGGAGAWSPSSLSGSYAPLQWALDGGAAFESTTLDSYQPLRSLESYGTYRKPRAGRCGLFDGTNDYGVLPSGTLLTGAGDFTATAWVKITDASTSRTVVANFASANTGGFQLTVSASRLQFYLGSWLAGATTLSTGVWYHFACVRASGVVTLYVNAVSDGSGTRSASITEVAGSFKIGAISTGAELMNGSIRDVRVYSVAKSAAEIEAIYNQADAPTTLDTTGLLGGWWLNEEAGTTAYDWSGNGKHLTLTNITTSTFHASDTGVTYNPANFLGFTLSGSTVIPRDEAITSLDAAGNALGNTGKCPHPAVIETPCVTGDGTAVYGQLPSSGIVGAATWSLSFLTKWNSTTLNSNLVSIGTFGTDRQIFAIQQGGTSSSLFINLWKTGSNYEFDTGVSFTAAWRKLTVQYTGTEINIYVDDVLKNSTTILLDIVSNNVFVLGRPGGFDGQYCNARIADLRITTGGVTTYYPLQEGPGASVTNRDLYYVKSDGTYGVVSGAIVNGTVANIWANRCPGHAQDWCVNYGGRLTAGSNKLTYSNTFSNAAWVAGTVASTGPTKGTTTGTRPDGSTGTIHTVTFPANNASTGNFLYQISGLANSGVATGSIYARVQSGTANIGFYIEDGSAGPSGSNFVSSWHALTTSWQRIEVSGTSSGAGNKTFMFGFDTRADAAHINGSSLTIEVAYAQLETNATVSAYDPTTSVAGESNIFIPGSISGSTDAYGLAKTLTAGKFGNSNSRVNFNPWSAPELTAIAAETAYAPTTARQSVSPADTKFRRTAAAGDDRFFAVASALTGSNKTNAEAYVA